MNGRLLPSHSNEQDEWNIAVASAAKAEVERLYFKTSSGDHITAWNALAKAEGYINSQQTKRFGKGQIVALEVIENYRDALALEPGLSWPEPFPPVYQRRAFWTDREVNQTKEGKETIYSLRREAGDPRWFLHIIGVGTCPYYFLPGAISHRKVRVEGRILVSNGDELGIEYKVTGPGHTYAGEVYRKYGNDPLWHIPRDLSGADDLPPGQRQGDKIYQSWNRPSSEGYKIQLRDNWKGRHIPYPRPYGVGTCRTTYRDWILETPGRIFYFEDGEEFFVFDKPPIISHPEHPAIQLAGRYVRVLDVPGRNMYLGKNFLRHD
jgi:hypothetical protein